VIGTPSQWMDGMGFPSWNILHQDHYTGPVGVVKGCCFALGLYNLRERPQPPGMAKGWDRLYYTQSGGIRERHPNYTKEPQACQPFCLVDFRKRGARLNHLPRDIRLLPPAPRCCSIFLGSQLPLGCRRGTPRHP